MLYAEVSTLDGNFHSGKMGRKAMAVGNAFERVVTDLSTSLRVSGDCGADCYVHVASLIIECCII